MIFIYTTCENTEEAEKLSTYVIESRIVACVDFWPIRSCYNWNGEFKYISHIMLLVTTFESKLDQVTSIVNKYHTYSVPLIAGVDVRRINHPYIEWMMEEIH